ncbi:MULTISPECIES: GT-D fold domain-containing glycosyltransferase [unclassified Carboxylicivirga]|uniref:GT-D fold domain-containing glycosyltransferase n=1 Tax=Carboxylicivirga TaxID=1628153 RepID=UPI003D337366
MYTIKYFTNNLLKLSNKKYTIETKSIDQSFNDISLALKRNKKLYFTRFGDGEILAIMKKDHRNYRFNPKLTNELKESFTISNSQYLIAAPINYPYDRYWSKGIYKSFSWDKEMEDTLLSEGLHHKTIYENPCVFQVLALHKPKLINRFLEENVRPKKKMFIGGVSKKQAEILYGKIDYYIRTPFKHAYEEIDQWWPLVEKDMHNVEVVIPSVGSSSNVIAKRMWDHNVNAHVIDIGSIIDALGDNPTRTWIRILGHRIHKIIPKETRPKLSFKQQLEFILKDVKFFFRNQFI